MDAVCKPPLERKLKPAFIGRSASAPDNRAMPTLFPRVSPAALLAVALLCASAWPVAQADDDPEQAHRAVQAGEVMPLRGVLERLEREHPGQVLEVELEHEKQQWQYEIKLLQPDGRLMKLQVDARTGEVLKRQTRRELR